MYSDGRRRAAVRLKPEMQGFFLGVGAFSVANGLVCAQAGHAGLAACHFMLALAAAFGLARMQAWRAGARPLQRGSKAAAFAPAPINDPQPKPANDATPLAALQDLARLRRKGVLSAAEFAAQKAQILSNI